jgi:hypothetical protein
MAAGLFLQKTTLANRPLPRVTSGNGGQTLNVIGESIYL